MATWVNYVHDSMAEFFGGIPKMLVLFCNFLRKSMVSDKKFHSAFRNHTTL